MEKRIVILGAGESGTGSAVLAKTQGFEVFVSDFGKIKPHYKEILFNYEIDWEEEQHTERHILNADEVIKSPGISSPHSPHFPSLILLLMMLYPFLSMAGSPQW